MDIIFIHDLQIETIIGVFDWERTIKQTIIVDLDMGVDITRAVITDHINDTLNYKAVAKRVSTFIETSQFHLVETLSEHIATLLITEFHISWVRVRVNKQNAVRGAKDVGIIIERNASL